MPFEVEMAQLYYSCENTCNVLLRELSAKTNQAAVHAPLFFNFGANPTVLPRSKVDEQLIPTMGSAKMHSCLFSNIVSIQIVAD